MNCEQCSTTYEVTDLEKKIRAANNAPIPKTCPRCRMGKRLEKVPLYGFTQVKDASNGEILLTSSRWAGKRPILSIENYRNADLMKD